MLVAGGRGRELRSLFGKGDRGKPMDTVSTTWEYVVCHHLKGTYQKLVGGGGVLRIQPVEGPVYLISDPKGEIWVCCRSCALGPMCLK